MAKKQTTDTPDMALVEALVKMWAADEIVPVGTVYPLPAAAANDLASRGMVRIIGGAKAETPVEVIEVAEVPVEVIEPVEVVAFDLATESEFG
jgi:hypothetical protein